MMTDMAAERSKAQRNAEKAYKETVKSVNVTFRLGRPDLPDEKALERIQEYAKKNDIALSTAVRDLATKAALDLDPIENSDE